MSSGSGSGNSGEGVAADASAAGGTWAVFVKSPGFSWRFWYTTEHEELASEAVAYGEGDVVSILRVEDGITEE